MVATPAMAWSGRGPPRPGGREGQRDDHGDPHAQQAEPGDHRRRPGRGDHQRPAEDRHDAARPYGPHRPEPPYDGVAGEAGQRHRAGERRGAGGGRARIGADDIAQVDGRPVQARPFGEDRAEPDRPDGQRGPRGRREPRRGPLVAGRAQVQHPLAGGHAEQDEPTGRQGEVEPGVRPRVRGERARRGTGERARAPHPVQPRHDRAAQPLLGAHAERVHGDVRHPGRRPVHRERGAEGEQGGGQGGRHQRDAPQDEQQAQPGPGAEAMGDAPRERHGDRGADRGADEREAEQAGSDARVLLDPGDAGGEAAGDRSVGGEDRRDRDPCPAQPGVPGFRRCAHAAPVRRRPARALSVHQQEPWSCQTPHGPVVPGSSPRVHHLAFQERDFHETVAPPL